MRMRGRRTRMKMRARRSGRKLHRRSVSLLRWIIGPHGQIRLQANGKPAKRSRKTKGDDEDAEPPEDGAVRIELNQHVNLTFSLKYLVNFAKSSSLSNVVQLMMSNDVPLLVSSIFCAIECCADGHLYRCLSNLGRDISGTTSRPRLATIRPSSFR